MARGLNIFVNIGAKVASSVGSSASAVERRFAQMGRTMTKASAVMHAEMAATEKRFGKLSRNFQNFAYSVSLPAATLAGYAGKAAYSWAKVGNELQAVSQMTDKQRSSIEGVARAQIGDPTENLRGALDLSRSGFDTAQIGAALPTVLRLAKSDPSVDSAAAADIATNVIQGMRIPAAKFAEAADQLAFAASKSSTDVRLLGESFKYAGPIASRMGSTMSELNAGFMTMANAGIKGSEAGVAFRAMLIRMVKPTKGGAATLDQLGIDMSKFVSGKRPGNADDVIAFMRAQGIDASRSKGQIDQAIAGGAKGGQLYQQITEIISSTLGEAGSAIDRSTISEGVISALTSGAEKVDWVGFVTALRDKGASAAQINTIFDSRQGTRIMTLMSGDDLKRNLLLMQQGSPGWLMKMFTMNNKGIVGSVGRLSQSVGNLVITLAETGVIDTAAKAIDWVAKGITRLSNTSPGLLKFATYAVLGAAVLGPLGLAMGGIAAGLRVLRGGARLAMVPMRGMISGFGSFAGAVGKMGPQIPLMMRMKNAMSILASAGFRGLAVGAVELAIAFWPVTLAIAAIGLALAFVVAKWNGIQAFFKGVGEGFGKALSPETKASMKQFADSLVGVFGVLGAVLSPVADAAKAVFGWLGKLFAPANATAWNASGVSFGTILGNMVNGLVAFIVKLVEATTKVRDLFAAAGNPLAIAAVAMSAPTPAKSPAALIAANGNKPAAAGGGGGIRDIHIHGANDPHSTRKIVREELHRHASAQRGGLHD